MERGLEVRYRARRSFETPHAVEAPPRLQVIGFNVSPKASHNELSFDHHKTSPSQQVAPKPAASSPRSALQQLLLNQSLPSTSSPSCNQGLPHLLPLSSSSSSSSSAKHTFTFHKPASSSPSSNHTSTRGWPQSPPAADQQQSGLLESPPPPAPNQKWASGWLMQPAANGKSTSGVSKPPSPPTIYQSNSSSRHFKSLLQSESASSDFPANQSSYMSFLRDLGQSPCASSSSSSPGNQGMRGSGVSVNMQMTDRRNVKPSKAVIKENYEAFFEIKRTCNEEFLNGSDAAKSHEIKGLLISAKEVITELPYVAESKRSRWLHDDEHLSTEKCKKSSLKVVQQVNEHPLGNGKSRILSSRIEEKSKKSSLFMFMVSSPATEFHHQHHSAEDDTSENMDFLSSCHLCRRLLGQGQDVFMYSGDKAFCSMECRYQQIVTDERKERCPPPIIRSGAAQVYQHTSITATTTHHPIMVNKPHFINTAAAA